MLLLTAEVIQPPSGPAQKHTHCFAQGDEVGVVFLVCRYAMKVLMRHSSVASESYNRCTRVKTAGEMSFLEGMPTTSALRQKYSKSAKERHFYVELIS